MASLKLHEAKTNTRENWAPHKKIVQSWTNRSYVRSLNKEYWKICKGMLCLCSEARLLSSKCISFKWAYVVNTRMTRKIKDFRNRNQRYRMVKCIKDRYTEGLLKVGQPKTQRCTRVGLICGHLQVKILCTMQIITKYETE